MLTIGDRFPAFRLQGVVSSDAKDAFREFSSADLGGRWSVVFFYPKDFTFVCPTEIAGFGKRIEEFEEREAQVFGASTDSEFAHLAWRQSHEDLRALPYPLLSDISRELSAELGILEPQQKVCRRATFVVDPEGVIRYAAAHDDSVGRNPEEVLRILDALQTGELCPCGWRKGEATLNVA